MLIAVICLFASSIEIINHVFKIFNGQLFPISLAIDKLIDIIFVIEIEE